VVREAVAAGKTNGAALKEAKKKYPEHHLAWAAAGCPGFKQD
jgi:hypothetical protein